MANPEDNEQAFLCKIKGARSKKLARDLSKAMVQAVGIKERLSYGELDLQDVVAVLAQNGEKIEWNGLCVQISSDKGSVALVEENKRFPFCEDTIKNIVFGEDFCIEITLGQGNYSAVAYGRKRKANA